MFSILYGTYFHFKCTLKCRLNFVSVSTSLEFCRLFNLVLEISGPRRSDFNRLLWDISMVFRETTLTISDSMETGSPVDCEIVRVISHSTTEITEITRFYKNRSSRSEYLNCSANDLHLDNDIQ